jgi:hypothetical protein
MTDAELKALRDQEAMAEKQREQSAMQRPGTVRRGVQTGAAATGSAAPAAPSGPTDYGNSIVITNPTRPANDLTGYLGHLANDDVVSEGHNVGAQPLGKASTNFIAQRGFRRLIGSASPAAGSAVATARTFPLPPMHDDPMTARVVVGANMGGPHGPSVQRMPPPTTTDLAMSVEHHKDTIADNMAHAKDHAKSAIRADRKGDHVSAAYNRLHAKAHAAKAAEHVKALAVRTAQLRARRAGRD